MTAGLVVAVVVIFLLLTANFQSLRLALVVGRRPSRRCSPASCSMLLADRHDAQHPVVHGRDHGHRRRGGERDPARHLRRAGAPRRAARRSTRAIEARASALRPILMTSAAMIAGMVPMALGLGEGGEQTAPLGRAVIGGLAAATLATLFVLPSVYALVQRSASGRVAVARSRRPGERVSAPGDVRMTMRARACSRVGARRRVGGAGRSCGAGTRARGARGASRDRRRRARRPVTIDVVRVVEQPLDVHAVAARRAHGLTSRSPSIRA